MALARLLAHGWRSRTYTDADTHSNPVAYANLHTHTYTFSNSNSYALADTDPFADFGSDPNPDFYTYANSITDAQPDADIERTHTFTNSDTVSDSNAHTRSSGRTDNRYPADISDGQHGGGCYLLDPCDRNPIPQLPVVFQRGRHFWSHEFDLLNHQYPVVQHGFLHGSGQQLSRVSHQFFGNTHGERRRHRHCARSHPAALKPDNCERNDGCVHRYRKWNTSVGLFNPPDSGGLGGYTTWHDSHQGYQRNLSVVLE